MRTHDRTPLRVPVLLRVSALHLAVGCGGDGGDDSSTSAETSAAQSSVTDESAAESMTVATTVTSASSDTGDADGSTTSSGSDGDSGSSSTGSDGGSTSEASSDTGALPPCEDFTDEARCVAEPACIWVMRGVCFVDCTQIADMATCNETHLCSWADDGCIGPF